mgnify:CR=1 FL=1
MRDYDASGNVKNLGALVEEGGFSKGDHVRRKADKVAATILEIDTHFVRLRILESDDLQTCGDVKVVAQSFLKGEWQKYTPPKEPEYVADPFLHVATANSDFKTQCMKGKVMNALYDLTAAHASLLQHLKVMKKPVRGVSTLKKFEKGKLLLVPSTTKIDVRKASTDPPNNSVSLGSLMTNTDGEKLIFSLLPIFLPPKESLADEKAENPKSDTFVCPFWLVRATTDPSEANMTLLDLQDHDESRKDFASVKIKVPILKNDRVIHAEQELVVYREAPKKQPDVEELLPCAVAKRRKVGK